MSTISDLELVSEPFSVYFPNLKAKLVCYQFKKALGLQIFKVFNPQNILVYIKQNIEI